jgi:hypothetical protein
MKDTILTPHGLFSRFAGEEGQAHGDPPVFNEAGEQPRMRVMAPCA